MSENYHHSGAFNDWLCCPSHCCAIHGCKYGYDDCPVFAQKVKQEYLCEDCGTDGIESLDELNLILALPSKEKATENLKLSVKEYLMANGMREKDAIEASNNAEELFKILMMDKHRYY